jgi:predicted transcriptional regulator of viral defense system
MNVAQNAPHPAGRLQFATATNRASLSRLHKSGRALRLASGLYAVDVTLPTEKVAHRSRPAAW